MNSFFLVCYSIIGRIQVTNYLEADALIIAFFLNYDLPTFLIMKFNLLQIERLVK